MKKFWQSSNFWIAVSLAVGGFFIGFPEDEARNLVGNLFATIGSVGILRNFFKNSPKPDWTQAGKLNFWNYIATIVTAIIPNQLPPELFTSLQSVAESLLGKNWNGVVMGLFSVGTILYYAISNRNKTAAVTASAVT